MLKNHNIICISSIDWDFIWQGHQEIMSSLAENGNRVLFIENTGVRTPGLRDIPRIKKRIKNWLRGVKGIRKEKENLYIYSPLALPFPYFRLAQWLNSHWIISVLEKWMKAADFSDPVIWTFLPTPLGLTIADNLMKQLLVYYCIDNFRVSSVAAKKVVKSEKKLLKKADLVFVTSQALYDYCAAYNNNVHIFPFAVNFKEFQQARAEKGLKYKEIENLKKPVIGYIGGVHKWIDQELVRDVASRYPEFSFVFVGPVQTDVSLLKSLKNVYFLGNKDHSELPFFIRDFDVCLIPYLVTDYTKNVYPTKLNEYLAMGKPVVSTDLPEIAAFKKAYGNDIVYLANDSNDFARCVELAVKEGSFGPREKRIQAAKENSWESRIEKMSVLIESQIQKKRLKIDQDWKENLASFYKATRRKAVKFVLAAALLFFIIFKTPFIWFCAEPLKIIDVPAKAGSIVVFAGGVGESGEPGQGYEERVKYAVNLFKQGYAPRMIFSSGYSYAFREPQIMKLLAVSLGVPDGAILLEEKAANTYQNVRLTKESLDKNDIKSILLVSSPYNMLRASLVFKKNAPLIKVIHTPVPDNLFYSHTHSINLRQLKGLLHEYLGIIYYWWKGWI